MAGYDFTTYDEFSRIFSHLHRGKKKDEMVKWLYYMPEEKFRITDENTGDTVIHTFARHRYIVNKRITPELLEFRNKVISGEGAGRPLALEYALVNNLPEKQINDKTLRLADDSGMTVAHAFSKAKRLPKEYQREDIYSIKTLTGYTVAHVAVRNGTFPWEKLSPDLASIRDDNRLSVAGNAYIYLRDVAYSASHSSGSDSALRAANMLQNILSIIPCASLRMIKNRGELLRKRIGLRDGDELLAKEIERTLSNRESSEAADIMSGENSVFETGAGDGDVTDWSMDDDLEDFLIR